MPATERYQADIFAIIVLIATALIIVFLVITAIYFANLMNLKPPSKGTSTFLFWTSIILAIIFIAIGIYAIIHIINHKSVVYEEPKIGVTKTSVDVAASVPTVPTRPTAIPTTPSPVSLSTSAKTSRATNLSTSVSDIPVTQSELDVIKQETYR